MENNFIEFQEYLKRLRKIYLKSLYSFYVFESMDELRALNVCGEKAYKNADTMTRFKNFFVTTKDALNFHFLMELAKLFDDAKQSLHINKLIAFAKSNNKYLTAENFNSANQNRVFLEELTKEYEGITKDDILDIENLLNTNQGLINRLTSYRDQYLAHEDKNKKEILITVEEIKILFEIIKKILNTFSKKTNFSTTMYSHIEENCKNDTQMVVEYLERFEKYRLQEIEKELDQK
ncbi:MAG: hypothetical protein Q8O27_00340 [Enterobacteriaceae bacterium]|nr:hypothetical protein [Enterobacteriaceae bacterium]